RDLVYSRLLPVRQTVGQFLAGYPPELLVEGLRKVTVGHSAGFAAEARVLKGWLCRRLAACGAKLPESACVVKATTSGSLDISFAYAGDKKFFRWKGDSAKKQALFEADFGTGIAKL